jgi:hypothetical protein
VLLIVAACANDPSPTPPTRAPIALGPVELTGVGAVPRAGVSPRSLVLRFTEIAPTTIMRGPGSVQVTLTDQAGVPGTVSFTGNPSIVAPGSLGATATVTRPNVLMVNIVDSDPLNIEQISIEDLTISASSDAALGPINAVVSRCTGSLDGCTASNVLPSPGEVVAGP